MTIQEFADMLDGREVGKEITHDEAQYANTLGYVIVYGASDDLCEFRGAINDEAGCYGGEKLYIIDGQIVEPPYCDCRHAQAFHESQKGCAIQLDALWCPEGNGGPSWAYKLHSERDVATFNIMEDCEIYCRGIVFSI